jgi:hypothetical protein
MAGGDLERQGEVEWQGGDLERQGGENGRGVGE